MSAVGFIKEFGWEESVRIYNNLREVVNQTPYKHSLEDFSIELKSYIEAYELVQSYGGLNLAKQELLNNAFNPILDVFICLKEAIELVEEI